MITTTAFYKGYQLHHHRAKAGILINLLGNKEFIKAEDIIDPIWGFNEDDYERMLRVEMRANLFHAIDTLFTLYFCLQPDESGRVNDMGLFKNLNKRNFYYEQIKNIAVTGLESLNSLDTLVYFGKAQITLGQYLFYYSFRQDKFPPGLEDSIDAIKYGLHLLALQLSDTAEYNAYKHALRSIPAIKEFAFANADTKEIFMSFDGTNSMTYFQDFKDKSFSYTTKVFDSERDFRMTLLASNLIYNIIMFRRASMVRDLAKLPLPYYNKESIDSCNESDKKFCEFTYTIRPTN